MALTEIQAGHEAHHVEPPSVGSTTLRSIDSARSIHSIRSLREIPFVETSFDVDFNTIVSDRSAHNISATFFSTPRYSRHGDNSSVLPSTSSPISAKTPTSILIEARDANILDSPRSQPKSNENSGVPSPQKDRPTISESQEQLMERIASSAGALASMNDFVDTWAPTAHYVVVAAAALQRDSAAFASTLTNLIIETDTIDPTSFASQYYQLREAYSSLLSLGDSSTTIYGQYGRTNATAAATKSSNSQPTNSSQKSMETSWDDRQLVDSFVTLLRTSPGFIGSSILQMSESEVNAFCNDEDGSALSVFFHGVLGSARNNRPRLLAEILKAIECDKAKYQEFSQILLKRFLGLAMGSLSPKASMKLERFLRAHLARKGENFPDFEPILAACLPDELIIFIEQMSTNQNLDFQDMLYAHIYEFACQLIIYPHQFGILNDIHIGEQQRAYLDRMAMNVDSAIEKLILQLLSRTPQHEISTPCWQPQELIALKGSDIILLYNSLLPPREGANSSTRFNPSSNVNEDDEWCLDSIRKDLIPVMQGLSHSTSMRSDGWQIFKVGEDGLVTDLGSDLGLSCMDEASNIVNPQIIAVCDAVARHEGNTVSERIQAACEECKLSGDHITLLNLSDVNVELTQVHLDTMNSRILKLKETCKSLRCVLDQAARDQRRERERLSKLIAILDSCRIHIWYIHEVKPSTNYLRARDFLYLLYPKSSGSDDDKFEGDLGDNGHSTSNLKSRRLSILGSHSFPESPFHSKDFFQTPKLSDKEVDAVNLFMKRNRVRNIIPAEEIFHRALLEIATLSRKLVDRDHLASYVTYKRDRQYQTQYANQHSGGTQRLTSRNSHSNRRSSLGLFDFFDSGSHLQTHPLTLHTTTSTQFLGLTGNNDFMKYTSSTFASPSARHEKENLSAVLSSSMGPPKYPTMEQIQALILSDLGRRAMAYGTETDMYMQQTGQMLLEGDIRNYKPLLDDLSLASSPENKLKAVEALMEYTRCALQQKMSAAVSRSDMTHELSKVLCREPGTLYRDLQVISMLVHPAKLDHNDSFEDCCTAANIVLETVVVRSMDYATRFLRYYMETSTSIAASKMALMGINDSVAIWAFCAKQGNREAQQKLSELYMRFIHLKLELKPLSRPSAIIDAVEITSVREAVALHWAGLASHI